MTPADSADSDADIVSASLTDPARFERIYDRHAHDIHRFAARRLGVGAAEDITADTFLIAFRTRSRYDLGRPSARPWLYGIASNLIGRQHRSEGRALRAWARVATHPPAESWVDRADARVSAQTAQQPLAAALAELSSGDRNVLLLIAWADLSYQEVAEALAVPIGTVRSRLHRARRKVRQRLNDDPQFAAGLPFPQEALPHG
jgi:RNA polymerase sigma-70 factor (ECF subfamily)